ncbi:hypothetical protein FACS18948_3530 [Clostridia bacterium]|nr:hypothetical protein FACS18948_3530 [Clostridia bacterium]
MNADTHKTLDNIRAYIDLNDARIFKDAGGVFKYPFIDPGSVYDGNLWDWDSYWTIYALTAHRPGDARVAKHAMGGVLNFLSFQADDGYIPMMVNNNPEHGMYLLKRHASGEPLNMHKPFLCQQVELVSEYVNDYEWITLHYDKLEKYFACYDTHYLNERTGLYVWADDVMIGMDNDPAVFGRPKWSTASVFLNAFMLMELRAMSHLADKCGRGERVQVYEEMARKLSAAIQAECWDSRDRFYYSVDIDVKTRGYDWFHKGLGVFWNSLPIKIRAWTGFIPMLAGVATEKQAADLVRLHASDPATFASSYGIRTLARDEKMYNTDATINPSN